MAVRIKIKCLFFIVLSFFYLSSNAQISTCIPLKVLKDIRNKNINSDDTIQIVFQNVSKDTVYYQMDVMMFINKEWSYSPYYTRYFNHDMSYEKMKNLLKSKLPIVFKQDYYHTPGVLKPNEVETVGFKVERTEPAKKLIKFRIHILNGIDKCDLICFSPFYFVKIKE